jgi:hypothetical protein
MAPILVLSFRMTGEANRGGMQSKQFGGAGGRSLGAG